MPFPARFAGLCDRCHRPYGVDEDITSTTGPAVTPPRYAHARCPLRPIPPLLPGRALRPLPDPDQPHVIRGTLDGQEFEVSVRGLPVEMFRLDEYSLSIHVTPAALCEQRPDVADAARRTA